MEILMILTLIIAFFIYGYLGFDYLNQNGYIKKWRVSFKTFLDKEPHIKFSINKGTMIFISLFTFVLIISVGFMVIIDNILDAGINPFSTYHEVEVNYLPTPSVVSLPDKESTKKESIQNEMSFPNEASLSQTSIVSNVLYNELKEDQTIELQNISEMSGFEYYFNVYLG